MYNDDMGETQTSPQPTPEELKLKREAVNKLIKSLGGTVPSTPASETTPTSPPAEIPTKG